MRRALAAIAACLLLWFASVLAWIWTEPDQSSQNARYALVLGAAVNGSEPSQVFAARIDHAIELWQSGKVDQIIFTGGMGEGDSVSEADSAATYAIAQGVPTEVIWRENASRTTMENLVFAQPGNLGVEQGSVLVVSDPLHMRRAMQMARDLGYEASPSGVTQTRYRSLSSKVPFALRELYFIHHYWLFGE